MEAYVVLMTGACLSKHNSRILHSTPGPYVLTSIQDGHLINDDQAIGSLNYAEIVQKSVELNRSRLGPELRVYIYFRV